MQKMWAKCMDFTEALAAYVFSSPNRMEKCAEVYDVDIMELITEVC